MMASDDARADAIANAAATFARGRDIMNSRSPRDAAEAAVYAGGPSVEDIERHIRAQRGLDDTHRIFSP